MRRMKQTVSQLLFLILVLCNLQGLWAQDPSYIKFGGGLNIIDNSNGFNIFWDVDKFEVKKPFFVELEETQAICQLATRNSLVIMDELGRGTSTYDGYSIAHSVLTHLC